MKKISISLLSILIISSLSSCSNVKEQTTDTPKNEQISGYIKHIDNESGKNYIEFDDIKFLTQDEIPDAIKQDYPDCDLNDTASGKCPASLNNGFYIQNGNSNLDKIEISPDLKIELDLVNHDDFDNENISLDKLAELINLSSERDSQLSDRPFDIEISNDLVTKITERYQP